jgi:hypothetical protein
MSATRRLILIIPVVLLLAATGQRDNSAEGPSEGPGASGEPQDAVSVADFREEKDVAAGDDFRKWMEGRGWEAAVGNPVYFSIRDGALDMVAKAGPVFRERAWHAVFNRDKLRHGIENQVLLNITPADFSLDPDRYPTIAFQMEPVTLPGKGADMRNPKKNDTAFCLLVSLDSQWYEYEGVRFPESVGYVWADQEWDQPVGTDPDYAAFLRYIPIGYGEKGLGESHEVRRDVKRDWRLAFPEHGDKPVPKVIRVGLMIDSNSVNSVSQSRLGWVRFEKEKQDQPAPSPAEPPR